MADLTGNITTTATGPASASADGTSAEAQPIDAMVKADQYVNAKAGMANRSRGFRFSKLLLGGQVSGVSNPPGGFNGFV